ncbi:hypothetical protein FPV67DRAFT_424863 [Lyophyllum atratum]|nr:hypothetical protein FPV67DRAFT_424863 [Lyophyllum atratum]
MEPTFDTESSGSSADSSSVTSEGSWESSDEEDEDSEGADESDDTDDESEWDLGIEGDVEDWDPEDDVEFPRVRATTHVDKHDRPDIFRRELRVSPYTFDRMVNRLLSDSVFSNNSQNEQMPVEDQLAITLYRFGHFGNAAGLDSVARWSGYAKGTVSLATRRVMTAILRKDFMDTAVQPPTQEEKERAKRWVERTSCKAWRDGWCMVDGTLVTLYDRPFWYGESYFDRKCNYSLNIQPGTRRASIRNMIYFWKERSSFGVIPPIPSKPGSWHHTKDRTVTLKITRDDFSH